MSELTKPRTCEKCGRIYTLSEHDDPGGRTAAAELERGTPGYDRNSNRALAECPECLQATIMAMIMKGFNRQKEQSNPAGMLDPGSHLPEPKRTETSQWETVRIFISSTFEDMHAERDYLVKQVFPELREWCEQRKLNLVDIDLRWGVKEEDTQNKNVVEVCLKRIDDARPFFLCLLGQRRGWVPQAQDISGTTLCPDAFPDLRASVGNTSVTEMEIMHALIHPYHNSRTHKEQNPEYYEPAKHAFFYMREPSYLDEMPRDFSDLRKIYTNEGLATREEQKLADRHLEKWRTEEIPALCHQRALPLRHYAAHWNPAASSPELLLPLESLSLIPANRQRWQTRWAEAGVSAEDTSIADPLQIEKAQAYNQKRTSGRLADFEINGVALKQAILEDLKSAIEARFPEHANIGEASDLQKELDQQEQFLQVCREGFISRGDDFKELDQYIQDELSRAFLLTAPGGLGKSTLLANWVEELRRRNEAGAQNSIHFRFIGQSDRSSNVNSLLFFLLREIKEITGKLEEPLPESPARLRQELPKLLADIGKHGKTIIILDALNQLESGLSDLGWLPWQLPENVKLIVSFKRGEPGAEELLDRLQGQVSQAEVQPFGSLEDRRKLVRVYLAQYLKDLDQQHIETLIQSEGAGNPLFLKVALTELRVFGAFGNLGEKIKRDFGETPLSAFNGVLKRLEEDPAYSALDPHQTVPILFGLLAQARAGLSAGELSDLVVGALGWEKTEQNLSSARDAVFLFLRQVRPFLAHRDGRFDFFYESFKLAVLHRYENLYAPHEWHSKLADYFGALPTWQDEQNRIPTARKIAELPYHLAMSAQSLAFQNCLTDFDFLLAKLLGMGAPALLEDFKLRALPDLHLDSRVAADLTLIERSINLSLQNLQIDPRLFAGQLFARLGDLKSPAIETLLAGAGQWTDQPWIKPLTTHFNKPESQLQISYRVSNHSVAEPLPTPDGQVLLVLSNETEVPQPTLKRVEAFTGKVIHQIALDPGNHGTDLALSFDGRQAVIVTPTVLSVYNAATLALEHAWPINGNPVGEHSGFLRLSPDGLFAFVIEQNTVSQIRLQNGERVRQFGLKSSLLDFVFSPDGKWAAFSMGGIRILDDVATKEDYYRNNNRDELYVLDMGTGALPKLVTAHALSDQFIFSADEEHLICVNETGRVETWQISTGKSIGVLDALSEQQFGGVLQGLMYARPHYRGDGKIVPGANGEKALCSFGSAYLATLDTHDARNVSIEHILYSTGATSQLKPAYGAYAVSLTMMDELIVWDVESGKLAGRLKDNSPLRNFSIAHFDDRIVIFSTNAEAVLRVWDISHPAESPENQGSPQIAENKTIYWMKRHPLDESICVSRMMSFQFISVAGKRVVLNVSTPPPNMWQAHYHPDGKRIVLVYDDDSIQILSLQAFQPIKTLKLQHVQASLSATTLSPDGTWLLYGETTTGQEPNVMKMLNLETGAVLAFEEGTPPDPASMRSTPEDGAPRLARSGIEVMSDCHQVLSFCTIHQMTSPYPSGDERLNHGAAWMEIHDLQTGKFVKRIDISGDQPVVIAAQVSRDASSFFRLTATNETGGWAPTYSYAIEKCNAAMEAARVILSRTVPIRNFSLTPDEAFAVLTTGAGALEFVSMATGDLIASFSGDSAFSLSLVLADGRTLCVGDEHGEVNFLRVENVLPPVNSAAEPASAHTTEIAGDWQSPVLENPTDPTGQIPAQAGMSLQPQSAAAGLFGKLFNSMGSPSAQTALEHNQAQQDQSVHLAGTTETEMDAESVELAPGLSMEFVRVPAGEFRMGRDKEQDPEASPEETPQHTLNLAEYRIGKYPVTNKQYQVFVKATGYKPPAHWKDGVIPDGKQDHPVVFVSWLDAAAFCAWASKTSSRQVRLPTEAEWEKAARGTDARTYPWGEGIDKTCANYDGPDTTPVDRYLAGKSPFGVLDMVGNALEWVDDWYAAYPGSTAVNPAFGTSNRVQRGGSWNLTFVINFRVSSRARFSPDGADEVGGFRCAC